MSVYMRARALGDTLLNFVSGLGTAKDPRTASTLHFQRTRPHGAGADVPLGLAGASDRGFASRGCDARVASVDRRSRQVREDRRAGEEVRHPEEDATGVAEGAAVRWERAGHWRRSGSARGRTRSRQRQRRTISSSWWWCNRYELIAGPRIFNVDSPGIRGPSTTRSTPMFGFYGEEGGSYPTAATGDAPYVTPSWAQGQAPPQPKAPGLPDKNRAGSARTTAWCACTRAG